MADRLLAPRALLLGTAGLVLLAGASGCSAAASRGLSSSEMVVVFAPDVTSAQVASARRACDGVGGARAEKQGPDNAANRADPLRFDVTGLGAGAQTKLSVCLGKQPGVRGFTDDNAGPGE